MTDVPEQTTDDLPADVPKGPVPKRLLRRKGRNAPEPKPTREEMDRQHQEYELEQLRQNTSWRRILFWTTFVVVVICALASIIGAVAYTLIMRANASDAVLSTWFGANVVQVIGILLVITRHLFPATNKDG